MADAKRSIFSTTRNYYLAKRVFIRLNIDSNTTSSVNTTPVNTRKHSVDLSPVLLEESPTMTKGKVTTSPIRRINRGKPPLSPNVSNKLETPPKDNKKSHRCRQLSKSFVLAKDKFIIKVQNEDQKLGLSR